MRSRRLRKIKYISLITVINIIVFILTLNFGGIHSIVSEAFYISAILSGMLLGLKIAFINTTIIGFLLGPLQYNQITFNNEEEIFYWIFRFMLIVIVGLLVGYLRDKYREQNYFTKIQEKYVEKHNS